MSAALLEARGISKIFPGTRALDGVNFRLAPGEVHALVGENGAGKTTLMMLLAGVLQPDDGALLWDGEPVRIADPGAAQRLGIGTVFQELSLVPGLSIAENIFLNRAPARTVLGLVQWHRVHAEARAALVPLGIDVDPTRPVRALGMGARQMVEMAKALSLRCRVLLLDEPTSALSTAEVDRLFTAIRSLRDQGLGIVFITHRIAEVFQVADRVTVLRDGKHIGTFEIREVRPGQVVQYMVGRVLGKSMRPAHPERAAPLLEASALSLPPVLREVSFAIYPGEILGIAGLPGSGREEIGRVLFGLERPIAGALRVEGRPIPLGDPQASLRAGLGYLPPDRRTMGLFLRMPVKDNIVVTALDQLSPGGIVDDARATGVAARYVERLQIHTPSLGQIAGRLSGGNQQKVALSKWLLRRLRVLIVDGPTIGVDVGARQEIHHLLSQQAAEGRAVLLLSSDLPELLALSHRIMVMNGGRVVGILAGEEATEERVITLAAVPPTPASRETA